MNVKRGSFFIGLGTGIILSSLLAFFAIFSLVNKQSLSTLTLEKEQIIEKAKDLGMIFITELPSATKDWTEEEVIVKARELGMDFIENQESKEILNRDLDHYPEKNSNWDQNLENNPIQIETVYIPSGSNALKISKILAEQNLIKDSELFCQFLKEQKVTSTLRSGEFHIPIGSSKEEILRILQRREENK